jgi:hypothetical protein
MLFVLFVYKAFGFGLMGLGLKNLDISKLEICVGVQDFISWTFEHFYIAIWLCMLLKNVLEILSLLMPKILIDQFVFV